MKAYTHADIKDLTVYQSPYPKIRMGSKHDGGYVISDIPIKYDCLISGGIQGNIDFESDFVDRYQKPVYAYDPWALKGLSYNNLKIISKKICGKNDESSTNLHKIIDQHSCVFIKMDIESSEYDWIESLSLEHLNKIDQLAIEFHRPDVKAKRWNCIKKINKTHTLIHLHANNVTRRNPRANGIFLPALPECTFIHNRHIVNRSLNKDPLPGPLDSPNVTSRGRKEKNLNFPPYVND